MKLPLIALLLTIAPMAFADTVVVPNTLSNGSVADADDVNANFTALADESDENDARIGLLESGKFITPNISLSNNDGGTDNTIFGSRVGAVNSSNASFNSAFGHEALYLNRDGDTNSAFGYKALYSNIAGGGNTAIGSIALYFNNLGYANTAIGQVALYRNISGYYNTATGSGALSFNTSGHHNTSNGQESLRSNTTGDFNTSSGWRSLYYNNGDNNTASGASSLFRTTTGTLNSAFGAGALYSNIIGNNNTAIGFSADVSTGTLNNATAIGSNAIVDASNKIRLGDANVTVIEGQVAFTTSSDFRLKEEIQTTSLGLDFVNDLNPVQYHRINNQNTDIEQGVIAQELKEVLAKHNATDSGMVHQVGDSMMSVRYNDLIAPLIKSVQELSAENTMLKAELAEIKAMLSANANNNRGGYESVPE